MTEPKLVPNPKPALTLLPHPSTDPDHYIHIISNLLTPAECTSIIEKHQDLKPSNVTTGTVRTRQVFEDAALADVAWQRLKRYYAEGEGLDRGTVIDEDGEVWIAAGLNEVWRLCCYEEGGKFSPHQDGRRLASINSQSFMTVNIYLNTIPLPNRGHTRFLSPPFPTDTNTTTTTTLPTSYPLPSQILTTAQPILGTAAIFRDTLWHDGEVLVASAHPSSNPRKYLLRTDMMFSRAEEFDEERVWGALGKEERARRCLRVAGGLEDAGKGGEAVGWYRRAFRLWPGLEMEV